MRKRRSSGASSGEPPRHEFEAAGAGGIAAVAAGGAGWAHNVNAVAVTSAYQRSARCAVPGCGRPRHDPIHEIEG